MGCAIWEAAEGARATLAHLLAEGDKVRLAAIGAGTMTPTAAQAAREAQEAVERGTALRRVEAAIAAPCAKLGAKLAAALLEPAPVQLVNLGGDFAKRWQAARQVACPLVVNAVRAVPADTEAVAVAFAGMVVGAVMGTGGAYAVPKGDKGGEPYKSLSLYRVASGQARKSAKWEVAMAATDAKAECAALIERATLQLESAAKVLAALPGNRWTVTEGTAKRPGSLSVSGLIKSTAPVDDLGLSL